MIFFPSSGIKMSLILWCKIRHLSKNASFNQSFILIPHIVSSCFLTLQWQYSSWKLWNIWGFNISTFSSKTLSLPSTAITMSSNCRTWLWPIVFAVMSYSMSVVTMTTDAGRWFRMCTVWWFVASMLFHILAWVKAGTNVYYFFHILQKYEPSTNAIVAYILILFIDHRVFNKNIISGLFLEDKNVVIKVCLYGWRFYLFLFVHSKERVCVSMTWRQPVRYILIKILSKPLCELLKQAVVQVVLTSCRGRRVSFQFLFG